MISFLQKLLNSLSLRRSVIIKSVMEMSYTLMICGTLLLLGDKKRIFDGNKFRPLFTEKRNASVWLHKKNCYYKQTVQNNSIPNVFYSTIARIYSYLLNGI